MERDNSVKLCRSIQQFCEKRDVAKLCDTDLLCFRCVVVVFAILVCSLDPTSAEIISKFRAGTVGGRQTGRSGFVGNWHYRRRIDPGQHYQHLFQHLCCDG